MSWAIGFDIHWKRDVGYGVPAYCDHPGCDVVIDRGLSHVCGGEPFGGNQGCGLYFCGRHLYFYVRKPQWCDRCRTGQNPFEPKPDHPDWIQHKLTHESWKPWRDEHPEEVCILRDSRA